MGFEKWDLLKNMDLDSFIENIIITGLQVLATAFSTLLIDKLGNIQYLNS